MTRGLSRRALLQTTILTATGMAVQSAAPMLAAEAAPPKEGGLSWEGLLAGRPGFHSRVAAPLPYADLKGFLSAAQLEAHHREYEKAVSALNAAEQGLATASRDPNDTAAYAALRRQQVASANDVLLHDFYFGALAPAKIEVPARLQRHIVEHMGSFQSWAADFTLCALAARAWAALVYDPYDDRWHNVIMDSEVDGVWIGENPLVVCDVAEHAYAADYKRREDYTAKFLDHVDWNAVAKRYRQVDRM